MYKCKSIHIIWFYAKVRNQIPLPSQNACWSDITIFKTKKTPTSKVRQALAVGEEGEVGIWREPAGWLLGRWQLVSYTWRWSPPFLSNSVSYALWTSTVHIANHTQKDFLKSYFLLSLYFFFLYRFRPSQKFSVVLIVFGGNKNQCMLLTRHFILHFVCCKTSHDNAITHEHKLLSERYVFLFKWNY